MSKFSSGEYWERRYESKGNSGLGSYGKNCNYKAMVINKFLEESGIQSVLELGCGDGNQLSHINYKEYHGFDISDIAIELCNQKFKNKENYYFTSDVDRLSNAYDAVLSLDVIYHIVEDELYYQYIDDLFGRSSKYVVVFSSNFSNNPASQHIRHRSFTTDVENYVDNFKLYTTLETPKEVLTSANFYFYKKKESQNEH
tara:strand:+ start:1712 stop:2308 length:597 start_codon:yes stop_codon:yes gene_type:complete